MKDQRPRRRLGSDTRLVAALVLGVLVVFVVVRLLERSTDQLEGDITRGVLLFVLSYLNITLITAILFVLGRTLLKTWLERLFARNLWLDIGRKRPIPHESWFSVAGYFFFYGHYYAALCVEQLPIEQQAELQHHLARTLLPLQEDDGSWWDYPLYNYHQQYGTAFALMSLARCKVK